MSFVEIEEKCKQIADKADVHPDLVSITLQIKGFISFIEKNGKMLYTGVHKTTIKESLQSLEQSI